MVTPRFLGFCNDYVNLLEFIDLSNDAFIMTRLSIAGVAGIGLALLRHVYGGIGALRVRAALYHSDRTAVGTCC